VYGKTHRRRSPRSVADEVEWIIDRYHPEMLRLADDVFTIHYGWLFEYMQQRRGAVRFGFPSVHHGLRPNE
jgi:hypothetical protein